MVCRHTDTRNTALILLLEHAQGRWTARVNPAEPLDDKHALPCLRKVDRKLEFTQRHSTASSAWPSRGDVWVPLDELGTTAAVVTSEPETARSHGAQQGSIWETSQDMEQAARGERTIWDLRPLRHQSQRQKGSTSACPAAVSETSILF